MANRVGCTAIENYQVMVRTATHAWLADEPPEVKGDGLGPNPFEMLLASLGCCVTVTVVHYAAQSKIPLEQLYTDVLGDEVKGKEKYQITVTLRARGELSDEDAERLAKAAHHCAVHKILSKGTDIEVKLERV